MDTLGRASICQVFRARGPSEEALRDTKEEAEEGSGAILARWMEQVGSCPTLSVQCWGCLQGAHPDLCSGTVGILEGWTSFSPALAF